MPKRATTTSTRSAGVAAPGEPSPIAGKRHFVFYAGVNRVPASMVPDLRRFSGKSYRFTADTTIPAGSSKTRGLQSSVDDKLRDNAPSASFASIWPAVHLPRYKCRLNASTRQSMCSSV
jgi:hypothetical protein